jgi:hypothetical protein
MTTRLLALALLPPLLAASVLVATLVAGRGDLHGRDPAPPDVLPTGGVATHVGRVFLGDVYLQGPDGLRAGSAAPLRLALTNQAATTDALVGVSSPVAARTELIDGDRAVDRIPLPPGQTDLELTTGVLLTGIRSPLQPGQWFPVTFRFAHAGTTTTQITVGPLGSPAPTAAGATAASGARAS